MHKLILSLLVLSSLSSFACENIIVKGEPTKLETKVEDFLCYLVDSSFSDLREKKIEILNIKDSPILSQFSGEKISFLSYFKVAPIPFSHKYFIGYNPTKIKKNNLNDEEMLAVLAHELAHTVQWVKMQWDSVRLSYSALMGVNFNEKKKFESKADLISIKRGLEIGESYTPGLISYRETNFSNTEADERDYVRNLYNYEPELLEMERRLILGFIH